MADDGFEGEKPCRLLDGVIALLAQGCLLLLVISALLLKRHRERPQRPLLVWALDVGKQGFSALACHFANLTISLLASMDQQHASQCAFYWVVYNVDQAVGTTTTILIHKIFVRIAKLVGRNKKTPADKVHGQTDRSWTVFEAVSQCGVYGHPPSLRRWVIQVSEWVTAVLLARSVSGSFDLLMRGVFLVPVAQRIDSMFEGHPQVLLFFVMVFYPLTVNITVACLVDGVLKRKQHWHELQSRISPMLSDEEPLIKTINVQSDENGKPDCELPVRPDHTRCYRGSAETFEFSTADVVVHTANIGMLK